MTFDPRFNQLIGDASREIANILRRLEESTNLRVSSIELKELDGTTLSDPCTKIITSVDIQLENPFRREWS